MDLAFPWENQVGHGPKKWSWTKHIGHGRMNMH